MRCRKSSLGSSSNLLNRRLDRMGRQQQKVSHSVLGRRLVALTALGGVGAVGVVVGVAVGVAAMRGSLRPPVVCMRRCLQCLLTGAALLATPFVFSQHTL